MSALRELSCLLFLLAITSCGREHPLLPRSGGKPSEVLIVGDRDSLLTRMLSCAVTSLPQGEPFFDVSNVASDHYNAQLRLARAIVETDIDARRHERISLRYKKDAYAYPQLTVTLEAPSWGAVRQESSQLGHKLRQLLVGFESDCYIREAENSLNSHLSSLVTRQLGVTMLIPSAMTAVKQGKDFVWLSDNGKSVERCICLYRLPSATPPISGRDSVMSSNLPGEYAGMVMHTVPGSTTEVTTLIHGHRQTIVRGLWEMTGDAMGGPFVQHILTDDAHGSLLVGEVFVYGPGVRKRDCLRQLEALLYTIRLE